MSLGVDINRFTRMSHLCGLRAQALVVLLRFGGRRDDVGDKQEVAVGQSQLLAKNRAQLPHVFFTTIFHMESAARAQRCSNECYHSASTQETQLRRISHMVVSKRMSGGRACE
jgi:hypothetical protein